MILWVIECRCGHRTLIPDSTLQEIKGDLVESPKVGDFLDFVCPECGFGTRYPICNLDQRDTKVPSHYSLSLAHKFLKCEKEGCSSHATVHTKAENDTSSNPAIPILRWQVAGITCYQGHPVQVPLKESASLDDAM
jgi:hypothetical protein